MKHEALTAMLKTRNRRILPSDSNPEFLLGSIKIVNNNIIINNEIQLHSLLFYSQNARTRGKVHSQQKHKTTITLINTIIIFAKLIYDNSKSRLRIKTLAMSVKGFRMFRFCSRVTYIGMFSKAYS
jgi:hypothetical protein